MARPHIVDVRKYLKRGNKEQEVVFLEVNSRPYLKLHDYPRYGKNQDLKEYYTALNALDDQEKEYF